MSEPQLTIDEMRAAISDERSLTYLTSGEMRSVLSQLLGYAKGDSEHAAIVREELADAIAWNLRTRPEGYAGRELAERMGALR